MSARERARAARLRMDAQRAQRDRAVEDAATAFFAAWDERTTAERKARDAVRDLRRIGLGVRQVATLLELPVSEVRRLAPETTTAPAEPGEATPTVPLEHDEGRSAGAREEQLDVAVAHAGAAPATPARGIPALVEAPALVDVPALADTGRTGAGWGVAST